MKVVINAAGYVGQSGGAGGAGVFLQYLVERLASTCEVDVLVAPGSKHFSIKSPGVRFIELPYITAATLRHLRSGPTVVVDPFGALPCAPFPEDMPLCIVIHDLMHLERPHFFTEAERLERSKVFADGLQRADAVVTFSADQVRAVRRFFPGADATFVHHLPYLCLEDSGAQVAGSPAVEGLGDFLLFPAVKWPHKNHKTVIEAFEAYAAQANTGLRLVMCGGDCAETRFSYIPHRDAAGQAIVDLGRVDDATLRALYARSKAVLFPTMYEGFGIPVLEAAYQGKMILASRLDVFDEILGRNNYFAVSDPLCHLRWMDAFAASESGARADYEARSFAVRDTMDEEAFLARFLDVLGDLASRYSGPDAYPSRNFPEGDRLTSRVAAKLTFGDIYGAAKVERGGRRPVLGPAPGAQATHIFRSERAGGGARQCIRAEYDVAGAAAPGGSLDFVAWARLGEASGLTALRWSVNDGHVVDLLPELAGGEWRFLRFPAPASGYIDFRGVRDDVIEAVGFELELHDPSIVAVDRLTPPQSARPARTVTGVVAGVDDGATLDQAIEQISLINSTSPILAARGRWVLLASLDAVGGRDGSSLPENVRVHVRRKSPFTREDAAALITPYEALDQLVLLEAADLAAVAAPENVRLLELRVGAASGTSAPLTLPPTAAGLWTPEERGVVMDVSDRVGEPIPLLDPRVVAGAMGIQKTARKPRFAVIETDSTSDISHHRTVTGLFLSGATSLGFQAVLGINKAASVGGGSDDVEIWRGFSAQVYEVGLADAFAEELARFVVDAELGPDDIVFMHSLSPAIVLGAARYVAANPDAAPHFAMRFFSTAEAMMGHRLSYVKILGSILSVSAVRRKMTFFCESANLISYYNEQVGHVFPWLLNPEHPSLGVVRESKWFDPLLGGGETPVLAYFGEAREEKGFDYLPGILKELLAADSMKHFRFLIQTGANGLNETAKIARARTALTELRAKHPDRIRLFRSVETSEQFYFLMKHARGVIAPYRPEAYGKRGTGVTLEALQMGLDVFALEETDLYATFRDTRKLIGVPDYGRFAETIIAHYAKGEDVGEGEVASLRQTPQEVCQQVLLACARSSQAAASAAGAPVLWVGNDTMGEGCSAVFAAQKRALADLGRDCFELFVPWPDRNWSGVTQIAYDAKVYGFKSDYTPRGLAWVARPEFTPQLNAVLEEIAATGPTYARLERLNSHIRPPELLVKAIRAHDIEQTLLNYTHLYPVIKGLTPQSGIVCETHDILAYQHAIRRGGDVSLTEKIDEFASLARFPQIVAISKVEQREMASACSSSIVHWMLPPYEPEPQPTMALSDSPFARPDELIAFGGVPDEVSTPSLLMLSTYFRRADLQQLFRLDAPLGRAMFFRWWFFFGRFEVAEGFGLTRRQFDWVIEGDGAGLSGFWVLTLSMRPDLLRAFSREDGTLDGEGLEGWGEGHAQRELGISKAQLLERAAVAFADGRDPLAGPERVLRAVMEANPENLARDPEAVESMFRRIAEVGALDLVLVGSGHPANVESFRWFIDEVYLPHLANRARNLFIAGSVCNALQDVTHRGVFLLGRCTRIGPLLRAASACPLPVMFGSGSPIKTIPALVENGAVTITEHIDRAFGLSEYGVPAFNDPRDFADDVWGLLTDEALRADRREKALRYAEEHLRRERYVARWGEMLDVSRRAGAAEARETRPAAGVRRSERRRPRLVAAG